MFLGNESQQVLNRGTLIVKQADGLCCSSRAGPCRLTFLAITLKSFYYNKKFNNISDQASVIS